MSAGDHLGPQFDELAAARQRKFDAIVDQVPSFDEQIQRDANIMKTEYDRLRPKPKKPRLRVVK